MPRRVAYLMFFLLLALLTPAGAELQVSFPLEGYYRPGRFMPVQVKLHSQDRPVSIFARDLMPTLLPRGADAQIVLPCLAVGPSVTQPCWQAGDVTHPLEVNFHPLNDHEILVGIAGAQRDAVDHLFPGMTIIPVAIETSGSLLKPASAWTSLDAVVLSRAVMAQLEDEQIQTLLAAGTIFIVQSSTRPDERWAWQRQGDLWILKHEPVGPTPCVDADAYSPTYSSDRGWPTQFQREVVLWAAVFCIVILALSLWRSRWTVWSCIIVCIVSGAFLSLRYSRQSPVLELRTAVAINNQKLTQVDFWSWRTTLRETDVTVPITGLTWPMFATPGQAEQMNVRLICGADGSPRSIRFHLKPDQALAILRRMIRPAMVFDSISPAQNEWKQFAQNLYARPTDDIAGQTSIKDSTGQSIQAIVINRQ